MNWEMSTMSPPSQLKWSQTKKWQGQHKLSFYSPLPSTLHIHTGITSGQFKEAERIRLETGRAVITILEKRMKEGETGKKKRERDGRIMAYKIKLWHRIAKGKREKGIYSRLVSICFKCQWWAKIEFTFTMNTARFMYLLYETCTVSTKYSTKVQFY